MSLESKMAVCYKPGPMKPLRSEMLPQALILSGNSDLEEGLLQNRWKYRIVVLVAGLRRIFENFLLDVSFILPRLIDSLFFIAVGLFGICMAIGGILFNGWVIGLLLGAGFFLY